MSSTDMDRLVADLASDPSLRAKFEGLENADELLSVAHSAGYQVDGEDLTAFVQAHAPQGSVELSDKELDAVAGGTSPFSNFLSSLGNAINNISPPRILG